MTSGCCGAGGCAGGASTGGGPGGGRLSCGCGGGGGGATGTGGGSGRSSGGEKPRFGNEGASPECVVTRATGLGVAEEVLVVSLDQSAAGAGPGWVRASAAPKRKLSVVDSSGACPM